MCVSPPFICNVLGHIVPPKALPSRLSPFPSLLPALQKVSVIHAHSPSKGCLSRSLLDTCLPPRPQTKDREASPCDPSSMQALRGMDSPPPTSPYGSRPLSKEKRAAPYTRSLPLPLGKLTASQAAQKSPHGRLFQLTRQTQKGWSLRRYLRTLPSCREHTQRPVSPLKARRGGDCAYSTLTRGPPSPNPEHSSQNEDFGPVLLITGLPKQRLLHSHIVLLLLTPSSSTIDPTRRRYCWGRGRNEDWFPLYGRLEAQALNEV